MSEQCTLFPAENRVGNGSSRAIKSPAVAELESRIMQRSRHGIPAKRDDRTANGLTRCIIDFLTLEGWQAERINTMGKPMVEKGFIPGASGLESVVRTKWIKGTSTPGSADISATINGRSVKIEVKIGRDRQSQAQRQYQAAIERAGGIYYIARDLEGFIAWYRQQMF